MNNVSEDVLMKASKGDMSAFKSLYDSTSDYIFNIALRITGNKEEAEEVAQDVFLKVYNGLKDFKFRSNIKTWIYRITVNTAINASKKRSKETKRYADYSENIAQVSSGSDITDIIDIKEAEKDVQSLLGLLNAEQRACIVLRDIEGFSYEEIAGALKININTVRSRLSRARQAILNEIRKRGDNDGM